MKIEFSKKAALIDGPYWDTKRSERKKGVLGTRTYYLPTETQMDRGSGVWRGGLLFFFPFALARVQASRGFVFSLARSLSFSHPASKTIFLLQQTAGRTRNWLSYHGDKRLCKISTMSQSDRGGIQALLAAEQDAQHIVANARAGKHHSSFLFFPIMLNFLLFLDSAAVSRLIICILFNLGFDLSFCYLFFAAPSFFSRLLDLTVKCKLVLLLYLGF